jgi:hypothetical protein
MPAWAMGGRRSRLRSSNRDLPRRTRTAIPSQASAGPQVVVLARRFPPPYTLSPPGGGFRLMQGPEQAIMSPVAGRDGIGSQGGAQRPGDSLRAWRNRQTRQA